MKPRIYADFQNSDPRGRVRLNCEGTSKDLSRRQIELHEGMALTLYSDDLDAQGHVDELSIDGVVSYSEEEHCWVAAIDWSAIRHASDDRGAIGTNENTSQSTPEKTGLTNG